MHHHHCHQGDSHGSHRFGHGRHFGGGRFFGRHGHGRGWGDDSSEGRGGRRRRVFDSGELRLVLLKMIADQPRHGYELIRAIEDLSGGSYVPSPGVVYPTLTLLQDMGQIQEATSEGSRKAFSVTEAGTAELAAKKAEVDALFARLAQLAGPRERTDVVTIRRAMGNLRTVLIYRLERQEIPTETVHQITAILDEAAQKIERL